MRTGGYKSFNKYLNGIKKLHEYVKTHLSDFKIRMFIDLSIYNDTNLMNMLTEYENIELVLYCCESFVRNKIHHLGVFGTLIRAFPMFDFPNNDSNRVMISDIDFGDPNIITIEGYKYLNSVYSKEEFDSFYLMTLISNRVFKIFNYTELIVNNKYIKPYILFSTIISIKKIPNKIIVNFIHDQEKKKSITGTYFISNEEKEKKCDEYICFGIDEYFLNSVLIPFIFTQKLPISLHVKFSLLYIIAIYKDVYLTFNYYHKKYKNLPNYDIIKYKIGKYTQFLTNGLCKSKDMYKCYEFILKLFTDKYYSPKKISELNTNAHKIIIKRFFELVYNLAKNKDYSIIPKDFIDIALSKNFVGYFSRRMIIHYNTDLKKNIIQEDQKVDLTQEELDKYHKVVDKKRYNLLI
jgi:hypothetical protein